MIAYITYAYRDTQLDATITDMFAKADKPEEITAYVINADDVEYIYNGKYNVNIKNVDYKDYHGCGRAYYEILTEMYQGEEHIMKSDPHCRFGKGWDTYYKSFSGEGKIVHSFCLGFELDGTFQKEKAHYSKPIRFHDIQVIELKTTDYEGIEKETYFMNAGCIFLSKEWVGKVGYDPHIAMWGEETDLSMRTYLAGIKMINVPSKVWHLFGRKSCKSPDSTAEFERMNRYGIERTKIKIGLREPAASLMNEWDKYGCDGKEYKKKIEGVINA